MKYRISAAIILLSLLTALFPVAAYADGPAMADNIVCTINNKPDQAACADLLIQLPKSSANYTSFNTENGTRFKIQQSAPIVTYDEDGYVSYAFHYKNASCDFKLRDPLSDGNEDYFQITLVSDNVQFLNIQQQMPLVKIALLDDAGNLLQVSNSVNINPTKGFLVGIEYDGSAKALTADIYDLRDKTPNSQPGNLG